MPMARETGHLLDLETPVRFDLSHVGNTTQSETSLFSELPELPSQLACASGWDLQQTWQVPAAAPECTSHTQCHSRGRSGWKRLDDAPQATQTEETELTLELRFLFSPCS